MPKSSLRCWQVVAGLMMIACALAVAARLGSGEAYAIEATFDCGTLYPGQIVKHTFVLENPTCKSMAIHEVKKDCACVGVKLQSRTVDPGDRVPVDVYLQTRDYPEEIKSRTLVLAKAGRDSIQYVLTLYARSEDVLSFPSGSGNIILPDASVSDLPRCSTVNIGRGKYPLDFTSLSCRVLSSDSMLVGLRATSGDSWVLSVTIPEDATYGSMYVPVEFGCLKDGLPLKFRLRKAVVTGVMGPIMPDPPSVLFGTVAPGERAEQLIRVVSAAPSDEALPDIAEASVSGTDEVTVSVEPDTSTGRKHVRAVLAGTGSPGPRSGSIRIRLTGEDSRLLSVSFLGMITQNRGGGSNR